MIQVLRILKSRTTHTNQFDVTLVSSLKTRQTASDCHCIIKPVLTKMSACMQWVKCGWQLSLTYGQENKYCQHIALPLGFPRAAAASSVPTPTTIAANRAGRQATVVKQSQRPATCARSSRSGLAGCRRWMHACRAPERTY